MSELAREPAYYAKAGMVWKCPIHTKTATGENITIGFPVCRMHEACGEEQAP